LKYHAIWFSCKCYFMIEDESWKEHTLFEIQGCEYEDYGLQ